MKAKDIAKAIGVTKKDVSSYLHSHKDCYQQNDDYEWSLFDPQKVTLSLYTGWMTVDRFEECLRAAGSILEMDCKTVEIIFPQDCKPMIDAVARILALMNQLAKQGKEVIADFSSCGRARSYLDRAGFFDMLDAGITVLPARPESSAADRYRGQSDTLVEFGAVDPAIENDDLKERLIEKFIIQSSQKYEVAACTVFGELIGNIHEHSGAYIPGYAGLQRYNGYAGKSAHIQTVVSDSGMGIACTLRSTLKRHHKELYKEFKDRTLENDAGLVERVMSVGGISQKGPGRGMGFKLSRVQATKFHGEFTVRQNRFSLRFEFHEGVLIKVHRQLGLPLLEGTHICFDFFLE